MALIVADRVKETSTTEGAGPMTLLGAADAKSVAASTVCANGDTFYYWAQDTATGAWETGLATWGTGNVLSRTVHYSSNANAAVVWAAGIREVALGLTATQLVAILASIASKAALAAAQTYEGAQRGAVTALTSSAASVAINLATNNNFSHTTTENTTLAAPSAPVAGQSGVITITQGATPRLFAFNTFWKFPGGTIPTLTAMTGAVDVFAYYVESASRATCQLVKDVK